ncbi:hypothetical protein BDW66DRAFT_777 [Aspergillus desertorum]
MVGAKKTVIEAQRVADEATEPSTPPNEERQPSAPAPANKTDIPPLDNFMRRLTSSQRKYFSSVGGPKLTSHPGVNSSTLHQSYTSRNRAHHGAP